MAEGLGIHSIARALDLDANTVKDWLNQGAEHMVLAKGNPSMVMAEFHKNMLKSGPPWDISVLVSDIIHVMDTMRELCGEPVD